METTKEGLIKVENKIEKNGKHKNEMTLSKKVMFICLLSILLIFTLVITSVTNRITDVNNNEVQVSGVTVEPEEYNNLIVVEIDNVNKENTAVEKEESNQQSQQSQNNATGITENNITQNKNPYYLKVNYGANVVTVYTLDQNGNYTVPVKAMICSTGRETPKSGVYKTPAKYRWCLLNGNVWGQYSTRVVRGILFHSVPYASQNPASLYASYYDKLGLAVSAGCIRLTVADAKWIYDNCPLGTQVEFYSSADPGPLGKPTAMKISGYSNGLNKWDPTDPDPNNPWIQYFKEQESEKQNDSNNAQTIENSQQGNSNQQPTTSESGNSENQNSNEQDTTQDRENNPNEQNTTQSGGNTDTNKDNNSTEDTNNKENIQEDSTN